MNNINQFLLEQSVPDAIRARLAEHLIKIRWGSHVRILVVVDEDISTSPGVGFGINRVIDLIDGGSVGCMSFNIDIGLRSPGTPTIIASPAAFQPKYTAFRFDMKDSDGTTPVLDRYQQVWCFGFNPDNSGGPDSNITQAGALPATNGELSALSRWMDEKKGGVFATGDHDYLGASMCHRIPRVRNMRRWTNADGVPPIGSPDRIDTLRPGTPPLSNNVHQGDAIPQPIQWTTWASARTGWFSRRRRPHPVLCHPELGPIDVMPDHAHEGLCFDTDEVRLDRSYNWTAAGGFSDSGAKPEFPPTPEGQPTRPLVIAYGSTLGDPPQDFAKGPQPARAKFPMISVYDGHAAHVGRVAVDSTWHHWMNVNLDGLAAAGGSNWEKIRRYVLNLAVWLAPPGYSTKCLFDHLVTTQLGYAGLQEYSERLSTIELGATARPVLQAIYGPCWVTQFVHDLMVELNPKLRAELLDRYLVPVGGKSPWPPLPDPCLTCPPLDLIEDVVLGGLIKATRPAVREFRVALSGGKAVRGSGLEAVRKLAGQGVRSGMAELGALWQESLKHSQATVKHLL
ncbi:hypothetical protein [Nevskia sp.]|uniref:hypothetical protein n=1 Tax=Nevskia sp. TaxID=1929292 RepID=UPI0025F0867E|nr:hypothetical protein [Nevskia sp.]